MHGGVIAPSFCVFPHRVASKRCPGIGFISRADREIGVVRHVAPPMWLVSNFSWAQSHPEVRQEDWEPLPDKAVESTILSRSGGEKELRCSGAGTSVFPSSETGISGNFGVASRVPSTVSHVKMEHGTSLETLYHIRASTCNDEGTTWFFSSCSGILELRRGIQASFCVLPGSPIFHLTCKGELGVALESLQGKETSSRLVSRN